MIGPFHLESESVALLIANFTFAGTLCNYKWSFMQEVFIVGNVELGSAYIALHRDSGTGTWSTVDLGVENVYHPRGAMLPAGFIDC